LERGLSHVFELLRMQRPPRLLGIDERLNPLQLPTAALQHPS
jgi:hypothetical protein